MGKVAYLLSGPQKLEWETVDELQGLPADTKWIGLDTQFQSCLADDEWGGDHGIFLKEVAESLQSHDTLVIYHANIETPRYWMKFLIASGLIANGYQCVLLSRWLWDYSLQPKLPVGNWEMQVPLPSGWDSPVAGSPNPLHRLPDEHDHYYFPLEP